jgi:tetratricopeptide (TPR) repeat protein
MSGFLAAYFAGQPLPQALPEKWTLQSAERAAPPMDEIRLKLTHPQWGEVLGYLAPRRTDGRSFQQTRFLALSFTGQTPTPAVSAALTALRTALAKAEGALTEAGAAAIWQRETAATDDALPAVDAVLQFLRQAGLTPALRLLAARLLLQLGRTGDGLSVLERLTHAALTPGDRLAVLDAQFRWHRSLGRYGAAWQALQETLALAPEATQHHEQALAFWLDLEAPERAADLPERVEVGPNDTVGLINAASALLALGNPAGHKLLKQAQIAAGEDAARQVAVARAYLHAGEDAEAVALLDAVLLRQPDDVPANLLLAQRHAWLGDLDAAAKALAQAQSRAPDAPDVLLQAGALAFLRGDLDQASALLERTAALRPDHGEAWLWLAEVACARGDFAGGSLLAQKGVRLASDGLSRHVIGDLLVTRAQAPLLKSPNVVERATELSRLHPIKLLAMLLPSHEARKAAAIVVELAWLARRLAEPRRSQTLHTLAATRSWLGMLAYQHWSGLAAPQGSDAHFHGYEALMTALMPGTPPATPDTPREELIRHRLELLRRLHGNRSAHLVVAVGEGKDARLQRLDLPPGVRTACEAVQKSVRYQSPQAALDGFAALFERYPGSQHPYAFRGELHLWLGDYAAARADFCAALQCAMPTRWALYGLGAAATLEGDFREASHWFTLAKETIGDLGTVYAYRGDLAFETGQFDAARIDLQQAIARTPARVGAVLTLGLTHAAQGQDEALAKQFQAFVQLAPNLLADAAHELRLPPPAHADWIRDQQVVLLRQARRMLRGNRSSTCATYFTAAGELRVVPKRLHVPAGMTLQELALLRPYLQ